MCTRHVTSILIGSMLAGGVLSLLLVGGTPASAQEPTATPTQVAPMPVPEVAPYFSLGDSIADAEGASARELGYVPLFAAQAWDILDLPGDPSQRGDYGIRGGETTTSMLAADGQLDRSTAEIQGRNSDADPANNVRLITVDIGGNDFRILTRSSSPCRQDLGGTACQQAVTEVITTFNANYPVILQRIRAAAGPEAIIIAMAFYNPFSGTGAPVDAPGDVVAASITAQARAVAIAPNVNAIWVDLFALFQGRAPDLTHILEEPSDIHPNDAGHAAIAAALAHALRAALAPPTTPGPPATGSGVQPDDRPLQVKIVGGAVGVVLAGAVTAGWWAARRPVRR